MTDRWQRILQGLVIVGLLAVAIVFATHPRITTEMYFAECRQYYAVAHSASDTARVDRLIPELSGKPPTPLTCGGMRHALAGRLP